MKKIVRIFCLSIFVFLFNVNYIAAQESIFDVSSSSLFSNDDEFLKVDEAFTFNFFQQKQQLEITFDIAPGYYLYRHQFKFSSENASYSPVNLPTGIDHEDEFFGVQQIYTGKLVLNINIEHASDNATFTVRYQGCAEKGLCYPPTSNTVQLSAVSASTEQLSVLSALEQKSNTTAGNESSNTKSIAPVSEQNKLADMLKQDSLLLTLIAFFVGGLLLSFTPCVFPMYPILTGIIVGAGKELTTKKAFTLSFFYVQGMAVTYTLLGIVVALAGAQFQAMFQHPIVLISLSILFIFLALSMFGLFNLALPASWQNKLNNLSNKQKGGSISGVITMGIISGLVASPCTTAPLTGALIYISQTGDVLLGASALYALSLGMGLPLLILGSSGGKILPKAGAWMNIIKNIFGLLLLAVPIFLLERIIPALITQILWITLILSSASYFYVINQTSNKGFWFGVRALIIFLTLFFGAMQAYQMLFPAAKVQSTESPSTTAITQGFTQVSSLTELLGAVENANQQNKTVMVDLYADWCIACKEFEHYTFNQPQVQAALANSVLLQIDLTDTGSKTSIELMEHFDVFGLPSILFFDKQGKELSNNRVTGFMGADEFTTHVKSIFK
ncbi:protein-disulfide reductase DsbD [Colwelliaceae bacterium 6471]